MRSFERSGIHVDQCTQCRGVFLDRGELERLVEAEGTHYSEEFERHAGPRRPYEREPEYDRERERYGWEGERYDRDDDDDRRHFGRRRKRGFLGELFEMGD